MANSHCKCDGLSLARRRANSDIPTGPTLAACGDAIARKVALTAPFNAAVASRLQLADDVGSVVGFMMSLGGGCHNHECRNS